MTHTILMIENNSNDELLAKMIFEQISPNINIVVMHDGAEGLAYLMQVNQRGETLPDLILLDLKMPKLSGMDVLRRVKYDNTIRSIPVVVFSSSSEPEDIYNAYSSRANSYIQKPMDYNKLRDVLTTVATYWLECCQLPSSI